jgi:hypothetical protein
VPRSGGQDRRGHRGNRPVRPDVRKAGRVAGPPPVLPAALPCPAQLSPAMPGHA